jgi:hypothetical protein
MGAVSITDRSSLSQARAAILGQKHERFAVYVASGMSYRESAELAGFCRDYGYDLMQIPKVRDRVESLIRAKSAEPESVASKPCLEAQTVQIIHDAMHGIPAEIDSDGRVIEPATPRDRHLARLAIQDLARLKGYIVERKQVDSRKIDLGKVSQSEMNELLEQTLAALSPAERSRIKELTSRRSVRERDVIDVAPETTE